MSLKNLKHTLKTLADDTRLRIINILNQRTLTVKDICLLLGKKQPNVSRHLIRLRLSKIVNDKRDRNFIYYSLNSSSEDGKIIKFLLTEFGNLDVFKNDIDKLNKQEKKEETPNLQRQSNIVQENH